jgi:uncharacterized protein (TIGR03000 family)
MNVRKIILASSSAALLAIVSPALAQHGGGHAAPAPQVRPGNAATAHDVLRAYGYGANAGVNTGGPLTPRTGTSIGAGGYNPNVQSYVPLNSAPDTYFPSRTTGLSASPLFPYSSATYPYGYGLMPREVQEESQNYLPKFELPLPPPDPNIATMIVRVPANADIWFQGAKTGQRGAQRTFVSPPLEPGQGFTYEVKARWKEDGKDVEQTRQVHVKAGENVDVNFAAKK